MKKTVTYNVDCMVDIRGNIRQAQCECAAGMGPSAHCKHIVCLLFGLVRFFATGELNVELTCTEKLQTFHRAKPFMGSPLKMTQVSFRSRAQGKESLRYDPRKPSLTMDRQSYNAHVRNLTINFSNQVARMPIVQLYEPANPYGICNDHDYCVNSHEERLLDHLKIRKLEPSECEDLETKTRGQASTRLWKEERLHRLHSSNFGRICKATDQTDMGNLARSLIYPRKLNTPAIRHGRTYESIAIKEYQRVSGNHVSECGTFVKPEHPFVASSPDGIVSDDLLIEVKCPFLSRDKPIQHDTVPFLNEDNGILSLSQQHDHYYQVQGQLYCAGRMECDFIVYTKPDIKIMRIKRDEKFIECMLQKLQWFFDNYFKPALLNKYLYRDYYSYNFAKKYQ